MTEWAMELPISATVVLSLTVPLLVVPLLFYFLLPRGHKISDQDLKTKLLAHAIITGGSSGIGLAVARELVRQGCKRITLLARGVQKLNEAKELLEADAQEFARTNKTLIATSISICSVDVGDVDTVQKAAKNICCADSDNNSSESPPSAPSIIFNVAGTSSSSKFVDTDPKEFERLMTINYFGSVNVTHAFLPYMIQKDDHNIKHSTSSPSPKVIIFTSSAAGQTGIFGLSAYSPTKYALRGLAEALQMEVLKDGVFVQVTFPPDTDTPGYKLEQVDKPEETHLISETAGLFQAEDVAKKMVSSALQKRPKFAVYFGLEGWMLATLTAGMSPAHTVIDTLCQIFLMGLLRLVSLFYLMDFRRIVSKAGKVKKEQNDSRQQEGKAKEE